MSTAEPFAIPTGDGRAVLSGQVDYPPAPEPAGRLPLLLVVPGGGFLDRDGQLGDTGTERDLVFQDLAGAVTRAGVAVLRWDIRGVSCNGLTMPPCTGCPSLLEGIQHYLDHCVDQKIRAGVTPENILSDIEQVYRYAAGRPRINPDRIVVWAHSEGTLNAARLVRAGRICPRGLVLVGPIVESPVASQWWLDVGRVVDRVMAWDADGDGRVTRAEVKSNYPSEFLFEALGTPLEDLLPDGDFWTVDALRDRFERRYEGLKAEALAADDTAPYAFPAPPGMPAPVFASGRWRKQWFLDDTPAADLLTDYRGQVVYHFGAIDSQNPVASQVRLLEEKLHLFRSRPAYEVHRDRGHVLRTGQPLSGPMDPEAKEMLVRDVLGMVR